MAEELNGATEIVLADGEKLLIKPLTIKQLRSFMKIAGQLSLEDGNLDDAQIDLMISAAQIALEKAAPELAADRDKLEDVLDMKSFNAILSVPLAQTQTYKGGGGRRRYIFR
jgi:hypothetical protein